MLLLEAFALKQVHLAMLQTCFVLVGKQRFVWAEPVQERVGEQPRCPKVKWIHHPVFLSEIA